LLTLLRISEMQEELSLRLEEINGNKEEEMALVKKRYIQLFNEKAEELHEAKERLTAASKELGEARSQVTDLQDREEELQNLLGKTRSSLEEEYRGRAAQLAADVKAAEERARASEASLEATSARYAELQESYRASVQSLGRRLGEITCLLRDSQHESNSNVVKVNVSESSSLPSVILSDDSAVVCENKKEATPVQEDRHERISKKRKKAKKKRSRVKAT